MDLKEFFHMHPEAALGFSGGVDSTYLLYAARRYGADVKPYFVKTKFQPRFEIEDALRIAQLLHVELTVLEYDIFQFPEVIANPQDRCYYCKQVLFHLLQDRAFKDGYALLMDGTNASDDAADRPGMRALKELSVRSPLKECGLTKNDIRRLSKEAGLDTWKKPAYACLATRIPVGEPITQELLYRVESAESVMTKLGFFDFRVRVFHGAARIQLLPNQMERAIKEREEILGLLRPYFQTVLLDLKAR